MEEYGSLDLTYVELDISGIADSSGNIEESSVTIRAKVYYTRDHWHLSSDLVEIIQFVRKK